jgi:hypothetical protein
MVAQPDTSGRLTEATRRFLDTVGQSESVEGVRLLQCAELIDAGGYNASGAAALFKTHRELAAAISVSDGQDADIITRIFGS